jgi:hypothetical protein
MLVKLHLWFSLAAAAAAAPSKDTYDYVSFIVWSQLCRQSNTAFVSYYIDTF